MTQNYRPVGDPIHVTATLTRADLREALLQWLGRQGINMDPDFDVKFDFADETVWAVRIRGPVVLPDTLTDAHFPTKFTSGDK